MRLFSRDELKDIGISMIAISVIFCLPDIGLFHWYFIAVIVAFLFHELAHRFVAIHFGCTAFYKMWRDGLLLGLFLALPCLLGMGCFKFVAPGAVMIYPYSLNMWRYRIVRLTKREIGLISLAGPAVNIFFAVLFRILSGISPIVLFEFLASISAWLAFFNLLPVPPLDGSKVFAWNIWIWLVLIVGAGVVLWV